MKLYRFIVILMLLVILISTTGCDLFTKGPDKGTGSEEKSTLVLNYSLDEYSGSLAGESAVSYTHLTLPTMAVV